MTKRIKTSEPLSSAPSSTTAPVVQNVFKTKPGDVVNSKEAQKQNVPLITLPVVNKIMEKLNALRNFQQGEERSSQAKMVFDDLQVVLWIIQGTKIFVGILKTTNNKQQQKTTTTKKKVDENQKQDVEKSDSMSMKSRSNRNSFISDTIHVTDSLVPPTLPPKKRVYLLCLDGGGVKGRFTISFLNELEKDLGFVSAHYNKGEKKKKKKEKKKLDNRKSPQKKKRKQK